MRRFLLYRIFFSFGALLDLGWGAQNLIKRDEHEVALAWFSGAQGYPLPRTFSLTDPDVEARERVASKSV